MRENVFGKVESSKKGRLMEFQRLCTNVLELVASFPCEASTLACMQCETSFKQCVNIEEKNV